VNYQKFLRKIIVISDNYILIDETPMFSTNFEDNHIGNDEMFKNLKKFRVIPHKNFNHPLIAWLDKFKLLWERLGTNVNTVISKSTRLGAFVIIHLNNILIIIIIIDNRTQMHI
jgi:hypothetical protein